MKWDCQIEEWRLRVPFVISRRSCSTTEVVALKLTRGGFSGHGEAAGINYQGETALILKQQIDQFLAGFSGHPSRQALLEHLPAGGARNALDCALWDLEAKEAGKSVFDIVGAAAGPVQTALTLSLSSPEKMAAAATTAACQPTLKMKLGGEQPLACVKAVRRARPDAEIIVDANEALTLDALKSIAPSLVEAGVALVEQPLPRDADDALANYNSPIPLCADESCMNVADLPRLAGLYDYINIKLDKTGGLTAALTLADAAEKQGFGLMVGCMLSTSLAMAPAMIIAPRCKFVDIDGPLLLKGDRDFGLKYKDGTVHPPLQNLWG